MTCALKGTEVKQCHLLQQTIKDLFAQPSGLQLLAEKKQVLEELEPIADREKATEEGEQEQETGVKKGLAKQDPNLLNMFEQVSFLVELFYLYGDDTAQAG